jgi:cytochrome P450
MSATTPSGPRGNLFGHLSALERDPLRFLTGCERTYGDVVKLRFGLSPAYLVTHPDHVKHVLQDHHARYDKNTVDWKLLKPALGDSVLTTDGDVWLRQRRLMQPAFHRQRIAGFATVMAAEAEAMLARWDERGGDAGPLDVALEMSRVTMDIVTRCLFGTTVEADASTVAHAVGAVNRAYIERGFGPAALWALVTGRPSRAMRPHLATLHAVVDRFIATRRQQPEEHDDLLSMLLAARDEDTGAGMDARQIRNEVLTLFVAGHETTSNALAWTWYLLARHPKVEARLRAELNEVLGGRAPGFEDVPRLAYTRMVLDEAMRLYPPAWATSRNATVEDEIGGFRIRKGGLVLLSPWVTHRRPDLWDDPEHFDPERFTAERSAGRPRFAHFPFGAGPHLCIGSAFALTEATLVLAAVAQRYHLDLVGDAEVVPEAIVTLRPRGGLPMMARRAASRAAA